MRGFSRIGRIEWNRRGHISSVDNKLAALSLVGEEKKNKKHRRFRCNTMIHFNTKNNILHLVYVVAGAV